MQHTHIIDKIREIMRRLFPDVRTILYGSQARGTAHDNSDIDLLIVLPDTYKGIDFVHRRTEIVSHLYDVEIDEGVRISPMVVLKTIWESRITPFSINVAREGIEL